MRQWNSLLFADLGLPSVAWIPPKVFLVSLVWAVGDVLPSLPSQQVRDEAPCFVSSPLHRFITICQANAALRWRLIILFCLSSLLSYFHPSLPPLSVDKWASKRLGLLRYDTYFFFLFQHFLIRKCFHKNLSSVSTRL